MNRRRFLQWLGGTAAGAAASHVLDVERLLWIPGERTIFLPIEEEFSFITSLWVTKDAIAHFKNTLKFLDHFQDRSYGFDDLALPAIPSNMRIVTRHAQTR